MINLIPPDGRKIVAREYWVRVISTWCLLATLALIVGTVLLVPSYVLTNTHLEAIREQTNENLEGELDYKEAESAIKRANELSRKLNTNTPYVRLTEIVDAVDVEVTSGIIIRNFRINDDGELVRVEVQGIAATRPDLSSFKSRLESIPLVEGVDLPISNLALEEELPFTVTLILVPEAKK